MLYFAYGSNMHMSQMADRCPSSIFKGIGKLSGYRWQINERGVANVVESDRDCVEGIVYEVNGDDKRRLDRSEGVSRGFYNAEYVPIHFTPSEGCELKTGFMAKKLNSTTLSRQDSEHETSPQRDKLSARHTSPESPAPITSVNTTRGSGIQQRRNATPGAIPKSANQDYASIVNALVYISKSYKTDGDIRTEYIARMAKAINDGRKIGLSPDFLDRVDECIYRQSTKERYLEARNSKGHSKSDSMQLGSSGKCKQQPYDSPKVASPAQSNWNCSLCSSKSGRTSHEKFSVGNRGRYVEVSKIRYVVVDTRDLNTGRKRRNSDPL